LDQVVPRLRPGGRKKLCDGFEAQDTILLFRHFDGFTDKRKLKLSKNIYTYFQHTRAQRYFFLFIVGERPTMNNQSALRAILIMIINVPVLEEGIKRPVP